MIPEPIYLQRRYNLRVKLNGLVDNIQVNIIVILEMHAMIKQNFDTTEAYYNYYRVHAGEVSYFGYNPVERFLSISTKPIIKHQYKACESV